MNYRILKAHRPEELEALVRDALRQGWRLEGGVCLCFDYPPNNAPAVSVYVQAISHA